MAGFTFSTLTPTSYLDRAADVFAERPAVVDGEVRLTYAQLGERSHRLAGALAGLGVQPWDRVAALCANGHVMLEMHHGVPFAGAVLVPMDTRLSVRELSYIVEHSGARVLVATAELTAVARLVAHAVPGVRHVVAGDAGDGADNEYESLLAAAEPLTVPCVDERDLLAINYTSDTTGHPKGVMYHHRGAALQALAMAFHSRLAPGDRYLWTLPMFSCDGWYIPWAVTAAGATHVCLPAVDADATSGGENVAPVEIERVLGRVHGSSRSGHPGGMGFQVTEVQKTLKGFDYPGGPDDLAKHAEGNGAVHDLVEALRSLDKDQFDGPNAVMHALGQEDELGGTTR